MEFWHYLGEWVLAVFEHWEGYVFGGAVGFILEFFKRFRDWDPSKKAFAGIVALGFMASIFSAWKDERVKYEEEAKKHQANLEFSFKQIATGYLGTSAEQPIFGSDAMVTISGQISNLGLMPSVVKSWELNVTIPGEATPRHAGLVGSDAKTLHLHELENFSWERGYLPEITATQPISAGAGPVGFMVFRLPNTKLESINQKGTAYDLAWEDINGTKKHNTFIFTGVNQGPIYIPGMPHDVPVQPQAPISRERPKSHNFSGELQNPHY